MDAFIRQGGHVLRGRIHVLSQQIPNTEPRQWRTAGVQKDPLVSRIVRWRMLRADQVMQEPSRAWPYRANPDLVAFAIQANLTG